DTLYPPPVFTFRLFRLGDNYSDTGGGRETTQAELIAFCREQMAHFKAPKRIIFTPLPKTSTGKVQKFVLRKQLG
ncbi:AMP-binding enzyme, partial [Aeromonas veronii]|uniref:AMP-binding enzyme n=1 Tax=Aeromonas veronii TaxID=654 RepID=UPI003AAC4A58